MICRSSTTGMPEHPDATALAQDALGSTKRAEQAVRCLQGALTAGHEEAQVFGDPVVSPSRLNVTFCAQLLAHAR